jgi:hypothetical protein
MLINFSDLPRRFTEREESGEIGRSIGIFPNRMHQMGRRRMYPHWHVLHPWPKRQ